MDAAQMGVLIPVIAVTLGITLAIVTVIAKHRTRLAALEHRHKERLAAIEKGIELPPQLGPDLDEDDAPPSREASRHLLRGLVCLGIGVALVVSAFTVMPEELLLPGSILIAIGAALVIYYAVAARNERPSDPPPRPPLS